MMFKKKGLFFLICMALYSCSMFQSPEVIKVTPSDGQQIESTDLSVDIQFSMPMDRQSVESALVITETKNQGSKIEGTFNWKNDTQCIFTPYPDQLSRHSEYVVRISDSAVNSSGDNLSKSYYSRFNYMFGLITPEMLFIYPTNGQAAVPLQSSITLQFNVAMDEKSTRQAFSISPSVRGIIDVSSNLLILTPSELMENGRYYTINFENSAFSEDKVGIKNKTTVTFLAGVNLQQPYVSKVFADAPMSAEITNGQDDISKYQTNLYFTFSDDMDVDSVADNLHIKPDLSYYLETNGQSNIIVHLLEPLIPSTNYQIQIGSEAKSISGAGMLSNYSLSFFTGNIDSTLPRIAGVLENEAVPWSKGQVNYYSASNQMLLIRVDFNSPYTNIRKLSLYTGTKIEYLYGSGDPLKTGVLYNIAQISGTSFDIIFSNLDISNYYKITLAGGKGGIVDETQNYLDRTMELICYSTN